MYREPCEYRPVTFLVRRIRADDWLELRRLRLEALKDSPLAFVEQYGEAVELSDERWQERALGASGGRERATFVATTDQPHDGGVAERLVGMAGIFRETEILSHLSVMLVGVYVTPAYRGRELGTAAALATAALAWTRAELHPDRLRLFVLDVNERAKAFYRRIGFAETGVTMSYPADSTYTELEMVYPNRPGGSVD
jgi:RimJ/RimL family protein N-acetyltransferase